MLSIESRLSDIYSHLHSRNHNTRSMLFPTFTRGDPFNALSCYSLSLIKCNCDILSSHTSLEERPFTIKPAIAHSRETRPRKRKSRHDTLCAWNSTTRDGRSRRRELESSPSPQPPAIPGIGRREPRVFFPASSSRYAYFWTRTVALYIYSFIELISRKDEQCFYPCLALLPKTNVNVSK